MNRQGYQSIIKWFNNLKLCKGTPQVNLRWYHTSYVPSCFVIHWLLASVLLKRASMELTASLSGWPPILKASCLSLQKLRCKLRLYNFKSFKCILDQIWNQWANAGLHPTLFFLSDLWPAPLFSLCNALPPYCILTETLKGSWTSRLCCCFLSSFPGLCRAPQHSGP